MVKIFVATSTSLEYEDGKHIANLRREYIFELENDEDQSLLQDLSYMCSDNTYYGRAMDRVEAVSYGSVTTKQRPVVMVRPKDIWEEERVTKLIKKLLEKQATTAPGLTSAPISYPPIIPIPDEPTSKPSAPNQPVPEYQNQPVNLPFPQSRKTEKKRRSKPVVSLGTEPAKQASEATEYGKYTVK